MKNLLSIIILTLIISCTTTNNKSTIYFGGEIINPKNKFVLLLKDDNVIDTLILNNQNRYLEKFKSLKEGLYTFKHGNEFQYIYLEPGDSILIRLNTWDFDESLVFTGKGSSKNEFLINLFLQNEKEEKAMYKYFNLTEAEFQTKIDSLANERVSIYNEFAAAEESVSEGFNQLTNSAIHFPLYRLKEMYPYYYKKMNKLTKYPKVSGSFYNYRSQINLNEENLVSFYPYQNYVVSYLYNLSDDLKEKDPSKNNTTINILNSIIENINNEDFKNTLLKKFVVQNFFESEVHCDIDEDVFNLFIKNCSNQEFKNQVENLVSDSKKVPIHQPLTNFEVVTYNGNVTKINSTINQKNSVLYFWSTEFMSPIYLFKRIQYLEKKYPNILFVGISINSDIENLANDPYLKKLDTNKQFKLTPNSDALQFLTSNYPRMMIVNKNGVVENGFINFNARNLHSELEKLEKN
ncbi:hypothetical protein [uncultured Lutibacter sp.]|uniref:TlpA family protein disulfide reductase n=1 Tax=uncultured Lutibacter sp. TaxID=437739 RepID=UPI002620418B|nr:hypothetical protein [uncultured Lutibacter sp.]